MHDVLSLQERLGQRLSPLMSPFARAKPFKVHALGFGSRRTIFGTPLRPSKYLKVTGISHKYKYFREDWIHYHDSNIVHSTDDSASTCFHSWNSWCLCRVLEEWPTSTTASSSRAEEASSYRKPAFIAQQSRVGDVCKVGKRIQSVFDTPHNIHLIPCTDSDIIHVNALGTSIIILNSYEAAVNLLDKRSGIYSSR
jgi:hypothetical protein